MKTLKITNLVQLTGNYDYKGLNIDLFVSGSQLYFDDKENNLCYVKTLEENIHQHKDIKEVTEEEYNTKLQEKENEKQEQYKAKASIEERISALEIGLANTLGM